MNENGRYSYSYGSKKNIDPDKHEQRSLNVLCVRLVFLLYAFADYTQAYFGKNKKIYDLE